MTEKPESKAASRDEVLKRMLKMPPKPHVAPSSKPEMKIGKKNAKKTPPKRG